VERFPFSGQRSRWWSRAALVFLSSLTLFAIASSSASAGAPPNRLDDNRGSILTVAGEAIVQGLVSALCPICSVDIGGRVQDSAQIENVYWDDNWDANNTASPSRATIDNFTSTIVGSSYLDHANQYGVHRGGFVGDDQSSSICGTQRPSGGVAFTDLLGWITCEVQLPGTGVPYPDDNTVYSIFMPEGATVTGAIGATCSPGGAFAFHAWSAAFTIEIEIIFPGIPVPVPTIQGYPFTVVPASCAIANTGFPIKNVVDGMSELWSHELAEATIDPFPPTGWIDNSKFDINNLPQVFSEGEAADICSGVGDVPTTPVRMAGNNFLVAPYWSNADNACVPLGASFSLNETGLPGTVAHTATLDGSIVTLPFSDNFELGGTHTFSYPSPVNDPSPGIRYVTTNPGGSITISGPFSNTAVYTREFLLTTGTDPALLAGTDATLTPTGWHPEGSTVPLTTDALIPSGSDDRYRFDHWSGSISTTLRSTSILMNAPKTAIAAYQLQHKIVFDQTGIGSGVTWHMASVTTPNESTTNVVGPYTTWVDHGGSVSFVYESPVPGTTGTQYVFTGSTPASPFTALAATTVIGNFKTQYLLTVKTSGLGANLTHIRNSGSPLGTANDTTPLTVWLDAGTVLALDADANVDGAGGIQYFFQSFVPTPPATMTAPFTTTAMYETMAQLIDDALASGGISGPSAHGVSNALKQKFAAIQHDMGVRHYNPALGSLKAFINLINAQCCTPNAGKEITSALAKTLELDALLVFHNALCKGIAAGEIGTTKATNEYAYYSSLVNSLGGTVLPPC
jgi:hypothetical protein